MDGIGEYHIQNLAHGSEAIEDDYFDMDRNHSLHDQGANSHRKLTSIDLKR